MATTPTSVLPGSFKQLDLYLRNAPIAIAILAGEEYTFEVVNDRYLQTVGFSREQLVGKPAFTVMPELEVQLRHLLDRVRMTGQPYQGEEFAVDNKIDGNLQRDYYSFSYERFIDESGAAGVFVSGHKVTHQVLEKLDLVETRDRFRQVADALPVLMSYIDSNERYVFVNKWYEEWFGRREDTVRRATMLEVLGEKAYDAISHYIKRALAGERVSYEAFVNYQHRGETWIHATYVPDIDKYGKVQGIYALVEDITQRKKYEDAVKKSESYLRKLADTAPAIIWLTDVNGYCFYLNREWYQLTGQSEEEALGFGWLKATHPDDAKKTEIAFQQAIEAQGEYRAVFRLRTTSGDYRWVVDKGRPRYNDKGEYDGYIGSVVDIDKEISAEQRIRDSEQKYRNLFNTMEQGFCIVDVLFDSRNKPVDYRFVEVNPVFTKHTGLVNPVGKTAKELLPTLEQHWIDVYGNVAITGESARFSEGSDVMERWFDVYAFKVGPESSTRVAILFSNVTNKRKAEQQLKESENRFRALVMATSDSIYQISPDWKQMRNLQGRGFISDVFEPIEDWLDKFIPPADQQLVKKHVAVAIKSKSFFELEHRVIRADGSVGWTFSRAIPIMDHDGNIKEWFGAASDVTQRYLADESLRESENRFRNLANDLERIVQERTNDLQRSNEDLERFAHVASHDLKEPVRKVKTYIDRLRTEFESSLPARAGEFLSRIDKASDRMNQMIEGVLRYSSLNAVEQLDSPVDITILIDAVVYDLEIIITQKSAIVHKMNLPTVRGSEILLYQLFYNLINNSLKFSRPGVAPTITIEGSQPATEELVTLNASTSDRYVKITLTDNGIGFNDLYATNIFETFTRLHPKDQFEGTGLGLALCRKIVAKHNGVIYAQGVEGKGATFTVILPAAI
ncbi:MAG TPA: PAS domain S-box protein [Chryseosolibacter sp.]